MYHTGPGVKKSGPKERFKFKGKVLELLLKEFDEHSSDPSHVIGERVSKKTGTELSARMIREIRYRRGKRRLQMPSIMVVASYPRSQATSS